MRGLRQDIAYKPRNEAKRAADEGSSIPGAQRRGAVHSYACGLAVPAVTAGK